MGADGVGHVTDVSVIICVYNGAEFVGDAIESALAQTHRDVQVIVVDDGSTDATPAVLTGFGSRIAVVRHEKNRGLAAARNAALPMAQSPYVAFFDHDDLWDVSFVERCVARLAEADPTVAGAVGGWVEIDRHGRELPGSRTVLHGTIGLRDLIPFNLFPQGAAVVRRRAVMAVGGFDPELRIAADWDLWLRLAVEGWQFVAVEECLWRYRQHGHNMSGDPEPQRVDDVRVLDKLFAHPALPPDLRGGRARAVASRCLHASRRLYSLGRTTDAARAFAAAVAALPDLLHDDETYYAIICHEQPPGYKASPFYLDLDRGEERIVRALAACAETGSLDETLRRHATARAYRALARLAYGQRRGHAVRRFAGRALRADPSLWRDRRTVAPMLKSFAGTRVIDTLSRWRKR